MDRGLMNDATSTDESPTSGYQLSEIARATKSSYQANTQIQQFLVERLGKPNHNTKFKALMIIKHVCRTGRPEFKREMGRNVDVIRECLQFKGPPDPLRGDEIYRRVRDCAREVLEALFDGQMPVTTSAVAGAGRIQGMGSDYTPAEAPKTTTAAYLSSIASSIQTSVLGDGADSPKYTGHPGATSSFGGPGGSGGGGGSGGYGGSSGFPSDPKYGNNGGGSGFNAPSGGFGNPNFVDPRNEKTWLQRASEVASSAASALPGFAKSDTSEPLQSSSNFGGNQSSGTFNRAAFSNPGPGAAGFTYASNRGANAIHSNSAAYTPNAYQNGGSQDAYGRQSAFQQSSVVPDMPPNVSGVGRAGGGLDNGTYEKGLIDALCEPGGLRPVPAEDKLQELLESAATLSVDIVGNCLLDVLNEESWQSRTKALIVIAKLVKLADSPAYQQWWLQNADIVESLQTDPKAGVRTQAVKTLKAIDPSASVASPGATPNARRASSGRNFAPPVNFTGDNVSDGGTIATEDGMVPPEALDMQSEPVPEVVPELPAPPPVMDLLEMDDYHVHTVPAVPVPAPMPVAPTSVPAVVNMSAAAAVSPLSHEESHIDLLGGDGPSAATYAPPAPAFWAPQPVSNDADSMFAGMSVGASEVPAAAAPVPVQAAPAPVASAPSANAFDFLNAGTAAPQPAAEVDLFGSLTIVDHTAPASATPAPVPAPAMSSGSSKTFSDDFAGLMTMGAPAPLGANNMNNMNSMNLPMPMPMPSSAPMPAQGVPGYPPQQYAQQGYPPQPGYPPQGQGAPYGASPAGLNLTRPLPGPGPYGYNNYPPRGMVPGGPMPGAMPGGMPNGMAPNMGMMPRGPAPVGSPAQPIQLRQGASVIAPGMLSHTAERKNIPVAGGNSGFNFMGGAPGGSGKAANDSFSFVTEAMKNQQK